MSLFAITRILSRAADAKASDGQRQEAKKFYLYSISINCDLHGPHTIFILRYFFSVRHLVGDLVVANSQPLA